LLAGDWIEPLESAKGAAKYLEPAWDLVGSLESSNGTAQYLEVFFYRTLRVS
jgi:hypothetical protein